MIQRAIIQFQPEPVHQRPEFLPGIVNQPFVAQVMHVDGEQAASALPCAEYCVVCQRGLFEGGEAAHRQIELKVGHEAAQHHVARVPLGQDDLRVREQAADGRHALHVERVLVDQPAGVIPAELAGETEIGGAQVMDPFRIEVRQILLAEQAGNPRHHRSLFQYRQFRLAHQHGVKQGRAGAGEADQEHRIAHAIFRNKLAPATGPVIGPLRKVRFHLLAVGGAFSRG